MKSVLDAIYRAWLWWRSLYKVLELVRFSTLIPLLLALTLLLSDQMNDALRALAEDERLTQGLALFVTSVFAGLVVWYSARTMLRFHFRGVPESSADKWPRLKRHLPRVLGVIVPLLLAARIAKLAPKSASPASLWILAGVQVLGAVALTAYVAGRRRLAAKTGMTSLALPEAVEHRNLTQQRQLPRVTRRVVYGLLAANAVFVALFTWAPMNWLGAPAILLLGLGLITVVGTLLVYFANHYRVPMLLFLLLWTALWSPLNDNHAVRATAQMHSHGMFRRAVAPDPATLTPSPLAEQNFADYFQDWWQELSAAQPGTGPVPVVIAVAEGGGIRAAYWTAQTLARLEDATAGDPVPFSRHVFAISAVSGGSLGAATFDALVARRARVPHVLESRSRQDEVDSVLGTDFLSPTMGALLFPDMLQRFVPLPLADDRAIALEKGWERSWALAHPDDLAGFQRPFHELWKAAPHAVPLLVLNSTVVETGQRALVYPLATRTATPEATFADALAVGRVYGTELPLSTAVLLSARFPYISPAGLMDTHRDSERYVRLVDGGYFDNTASVTAQELVLTLRRLHASFGGGRAMRLIVLHIPNDPVLPAAAPSWLARTLQGYEWLSETTTPVRALWSAADGRGRQAVDYLQGSADSSALQGKEFDITLYRNGSDLPLGWELSDLVRRQMRMQLETCLPALAQRCAAPTLDAVLEALRD